MSGLTRRADAQIVSLNDGDGNGSNDFVTYETPKTIRARILNPDDPNAASQAVLGLLDATRTRPFQAFRELAGWGCFFVLIACFGLAILRKGEPELVNTSGIVHNISPNVIGTNLGYWAKCGLQDVATATHNSTVATVESNRDSTSKVALVRQTRARID